MQSILVHTGTARTAVWAGQLRKLSFLWQYSTNWETDCFNELQLLLILIAHPHEKWWIFPLIVSLMILRVSPKRSVFWTCEALERSWGWTTNWGEFCRLQTAAAPADDTAVSCDGESLTDFHVFLLLHAGNICTLTVNQSVWRAESLSLLFSLWSQCASIALCTASMWCACKYSSILHNNNRSNWSWLYLGSGQGSAPESKMTLCSPACPNVKWDWRMEGMSSRREARL